ncbi:MAG: polyprenol monophosphomannose synthase [Armatimonadota bacterium]|nr:polyprenol monophosphomannose synthase [Armatimonadota bacterium]MDR7470261.1 polyprenol monophosphomannose synthase [Armatimonadota bacterium]MDR7538413.1 polyprenol monophosphomannose synthase [Armatimonadota bacterium]
MRLAMTARTALILPTYNEREALPRLVAALRPLVPVMDLEVIVVDDASPDGTAEVAAALAADGPVPIRVIRRPGKAGLASAVLAGAAVASAPVVAVMDCDGSHPPEVLPALVAAVQRGADLAVASRYVPGGRIQRWPAWRRLASMVATAGARLLLRLAVRDPLSGYFAARREVLAGDYWGLGFKILLEILARNPGLTVVEVGYTFTDRATGRSKLSPREVIAYLRLLGRLLVSR